MRNKFEIFSYRSDPIFFLQDEHMWDYFGISMFVSSSISPDIKVLYHWKNNIAKMKENYLKTYEKKSYLFIIFARTSF